LEKDEGYRNDLARLVEDKKAKEILWKAADWWYNNEMVK
jgi:hypothetical protein